MGDELAPGVAGGVDYVLVGLEDAVGEPVRAQVLPDILDRVQFRGAGGQEDHRDVLRDREGSGRVPPGPIEQQDGMGAPGDGAGDLVEVKLHRVRVGERQRQRGARAAPNR